MLAMKSAQTEQYMRPQAVELQTRLLEPRRFLQVLSGSRQVGKTTLVRQVAQRSGLPYHYATADEPTLRDAVWVHQQWQTARLLAAEADRDGAVLILDEIQKIADWSEVIKQLWDEDTLDRVPLQVVLLGSAPAMMSRGLGDSLAGRFELMPLPHWNLDEMREAFGWSLEQYLYYGAYPGGASLIDQPERWMRYIRDSLLEPVIARDVSLLSDIRKPALLRRVLELACVYSGQILSYTKMIGQLQDAGNTTTVAHYLDLLEKAGLVAGLQKYAGDGARRRASIPKLQVFNTALMTAHSDRTLAEAQEDRAFWGRLVESAVGSHLINSAMAGDCKVNYWRERDREVDFVVTRGQRVAAIEVKSGAVGKLRGVQAFDDLYPGSRKLLVGRNGIDLEKFLTMPVTDWL